MIELDEPVYPVVSVIIPVYNSGKYLANCLDSVLGQTLPNIEILCVDDGSTDDSLEILSAYRERDSRVIVVKQDNLGAGAARNKGTRYAKGKYIHYMDSDDWIEPQTYEIMVKKITKYGADVGIFQKYYYDMSSGETIPSIRSFPDDDHITNFLLNPSFLIHSPVVPWNKLAERSLIVDNALKFDEIPCANDRSFYFSLISHAKKIVVCKDLLYYYRVNNSKSLVGTTRSIHYDAHFVAYHSTINNLPNCSREVLKLIVDACYIDFMFFYDKSKVRYKLWIYNQLHTFFNQNPVEDIIDSVNDYPWGWKYSFIKNHKYGFVLLSLYEYTQKLLSSSKSDATSTSVKVDLEIIVSLTTFPERVHCVSKTLKSLYSQTHSPDRIILWLADSQFPDGENNLPREILSFKKRGLEIRFCRDLKPHKKYYYSMLENRNSIVITVDDDIIYDSDMIECLLKCHLQFPYAVCAMRVHRMCYSYGGLEKYSNWDFVDDSFYYKPSMMALATGVGGVLYPPGCIPNDAFNIEIIEKTCLFADDLWLKINEVRNGVPVVLAAFNRKLKYVEGSQETALWKDNKNGGQNDVQMGAIEQYYVHLGEKNPLLLIRNSLMEKYYNITIIVEYYEGLSEDYLSHSIVHIPSYIEVLLINVPWNHTAIYDELSLKNQNFRYIVEKDRQVPLFYLASVSRGRFITFLQEMKPIDIRYIDKMRSIIQGNSEYLPQYVTHINNEITYKCIGDYCLEREKILTTSFPHLFDRFSYLIYLSLNCETYDFGEIVDSDLNLECYTADSVRLLHLAILDKDVSYICHCTGEKGRLVKCIFNSGIYEEQFESRISYDSLQFTSKLCPICNRSFTCFIPAGKKLRDNVECPVCGSYERIRSIWLYLPMISPPIKSYIFINPPSRMKPYLTNYGITTTTFNNIQNQKHEYDLVLCPSVNKKNLDAFLQSTLLMCAGGTYIVPIIISKDLSNYYVSDFGICLDDFKVLMSEYGVDLDVIWVKDLFFKETIIKYSLLPNETLLVMRKRV